MTGEATQKVLVTREGAVLIVTINRPESRNAIDRETSLALAEAMDQLDNDPALSLAILTGARGHFCAGMDLKAFVAGERVELPGRGLAGMTQSPPAKPLIAAVEGYALAGGFEIALACDLPARTHAAPDRHGMRADRPDDPGHRGRALGADQPPFRAGRCARHGQKPGCRNRQECTNVTDRQQGDRRPGWPLAGRHPLDPAERNS